MLAIIAMATARKHRAPPVQQTRTLAPPRRLRVLLAILARTLAAQLHLVLVAFKVTTVQETQTSKRAAQAPTTQTQAQRPALLAQHVALVQRAQQPQQRRQARALPALLAHSQPQLA